MEARGDYGAHYGGMHCPACGVGLREGEACTIPGCPEAKRAARRRPVRNMTGAEALRRLASGNMTGEQALRSLDGGRMTGRAAVEHLDRMDEIERRSRDWELVEAYADMLGLPLGGVSHEPGWPS